MLRALTLEITGTLVCMSVPLGRVYGDAIRHYGLTCPDDAGMKAAFKAAYAKTSKAQPNFGAPAGLSERQWWSGMIRNTLEEAGCHDALEAVSYTHLTLPTICSV